MFGVTILGNNSALPAFNRHPTAQVITIGDQLLLLDCGEGTQMQMSIYKIRRSRINNIFISHLHGDHYFGLAGLINSYGLQGRKNDLHIYAPPALKKIIELQLDVANTKLSFGLYVKDLTNEGLLADEQDFTVSCFKVYHRIECWGFLIKEKKKPRKILAEKAFAAGVPVSAFESLKEGKDYTDEHGNIIKNNEVTIAARPALSYAYCADTAYNERLAEKLEFVDLLYHESTYLKEDKQRAAERYHSTTEEAAKIAKLSGAKKLLLGHFSSRYEELDSFLSEAREIFPATELAQEGTTFYVK